MGSELADNCTCLQRDTIQLTRCLDVRRTLHQPNSCIGKYVTHSSITVDPTPVALLSLSLYEDPL